MRAILMLMVVLFGCAVFATDHVFAADTATADKPTAEPAAQSGAEEKASPDSTGGETWRYRRHNGRWWYWLPSNRWVYWTGDQWINHEETTRQPTNAGGVQRQRNYSYQDNQGNWGPKRYDRWGQPEYPYSKRKSGLKQLGPCQPWGVCARCPAGAANVERTRKGVENYLNSAPPGV